MVSLGRRIRKERREREWSQRFLGKLIGVTGSCIYYYEQRGIQPPKDKIRALEQIFQIDLQGGNDGKPESTS